MTAVAIAPELLEIATAPCALGTVLIARSSQGICAIQLGDSAESVRAAFEAGLEPGTVAIDASAEMASEVRQVLDLLADPSRPIAFALDLRGTPFQCQVWEALRQVPAGATISYLDLARRLGNPSAVRAVAQACGANPVAVAVPCHRVVQSNGGLGGYHWGMERKRALLAQERAV
jgi:AraC family transcriptional regulator of adaptative response/methylated-DNA-[protein]-cysteine methyltransferase